MSRNDPAKLRKLARETEEPASLLEEECVVLGLFPHDRALPALARLVDAQDRRHLLERALPDHPDLWDVPLDTIRYKPERRYVARAGTDGHCVLLKAFTARDFSRASSAAKGFQPRGRLRTARREGASDRHRILAFEWLPGEPLSSMAKRPPALLAEVGEALAELHGQSPKRLPQLSRETEAFALICAARTIGQLLPSRAERAASLGATLATRLLALPASTVPVHGDFSADQVLCGDREVAIIDLDNAVRADPASDLGSFVAALHAETLDGRLPATAVESAVDALLEGYGERSGDLRDRTRLYTASSLLLTAVEPFRYRRPDWSEEIARTLERAEDLLR